MKDAPHKIEALLSEVAPRLLQYLSFEALKRRLGHHPLASDTQHPPDALNEWRMRWQLLLGTPQRPGPLARCSAQPRIFPPLGDKRMPQRVRVTVMLLSCFFLLSALLGEGRAKAGSPSTAPLPTSSPPSLLERVQQQLFPGEPYTALLIVGNNAHITSTQRHLQYAEANALSVAQQLKHLLPNAPLELLLSMERPETRQQVEANGWWVEPPTLQALEEAVERLARFIAEARQKEPGRMVQVLVYFSTHGEPDGSLHLDDYLTPSFKQRLLKQLNADQVLEIADTCHAGRAVGGEGSPLPRPVRVPQTPARAPRGYGLLASTEEIPELDALRGGFLTMVVLSGLYGLADHNDDGLISWEELVSFVGDQLAEQPPAPALLTRLGQAPDLPLVSLNTLGRTGIRLDGGVPTGIVQLYRLEPDGAHVSASGRQTRTLLTQFYHHRGRKAELRLPVGRYQLVRLLEPGELPRAGISLPVERLLEEKLYPATSFEFTLTEKTRHHISREKLGPLMLAQQQRRGEGWVPPQWPQLLISAEQAELIQRLRSRYDRHHAGFRVQQTFTLSLDIPGTVLKLGEPETPTPLGMGLQASWTLPRWQQGGLTLDVGPGLGYGLSWQPGVFTNAQQGEELSTLLLHRLSLGAVAKQTLKKGRLSLGSTQRLSWSPAWATEGYALAFFEQSACQTLEDQSCARRFLFLNDVTAELSWYAIARLLPGVELGPVLRLEGLFFNSARAGAPLVTWSVGMELRRALWTP